MAGGQVWMEGGGCVSKKYHSGHTEFEGLGGTEDMHSSQAVACGGAPAHGEGPGPAERGQFSWVKS